MRVTLQLVVSLLCSSYRRCVGRIVVVSFVSLLCWSYRCCVVRIVVVLVVSLLCWSYRRCVGRIVVVSFVSLLCWSYRCCVGRIVVVLVVSLLCRSYRCCVGRIVVVLFVSLLCWSYRCCVGRIVVVLVVSLLCRSYRCCVGRIVVVLFVSLLCWSYRCCVGRIVVVLVVSLLCCSYRRCVVRIVVLLFVSSFSWSYRCCVVRIVVVLVLSLLCCSYRCCVGRIVVVLVVSLLCWSYRRCVVRIVVVLVVSLLCCSYRRCVGRIVVVLFVSSFCWSYRRCVGRIVLCRCWRARVCVPPGSQHHVHVGQPLGVGVHLTRHRARVPHHALWRWGKEQTRSALFLSGASDPSIEPLISPSNDWSTTQSPHSDSYGLGAVPTLSSFNKIMLTDHFSQFRLSRHKKPFSCSAGTAPGASEFNAPPPTPAGAITVRTHGSPRVVNRSSRFHTSAGLDDMERGVVIPSGTGRHSPGNVTSQSSSGSPGDGSLTSGGSGALFRDNMATSGISNNGLANARLPPLPHPLILCPFAQIRTPLGPRCSGPCCSSTAQSSTKSNGRVSATEAVGAVAKFSPSRGWLGGGPTQTRTGAQVKFTSSGCFGIAPRVVPGGFGRVDWSIHWLNHLCNIYAFINWLMCNWLVDWATHWLINPLIGRFTYWLIYWLSDRWLDDESVGVVDSPIYYYYGLII